ncbi:MAG: hypothetical protein AC479_02180 [miscellaneous Crenarchaeota group-6 archaeon AD8-1]|nr:MAG: hypothetical protein AC479_02180 [miscellaneous Crenarchaeota group-6 archaeon AD8-1]
MKEKLTSSNSKKNVFALGSVSFFTDLSSEMVLSLLPTFIISLPGSNPAILGFIEGIAEALSYSMRAISGFFSDKIGKRKNLVLGGYALSNIIKPFFGVVNNAFGALIIRVLDRVGKGIRTSPRDALICDSIPEKNRGVAFGIHRTLDQAGAIVGPILASILLIIFGFTAREVFWFSIIPGLVALVILIFFVKDETCKKQSEFTFLRGLKNLLKGKFLWLLAIVSIFSLGAFNFSFILLYGSDVGINNQYIPLLFALVNIAHVAIAIPAGIISDKIGREKMLFIGYLIFLAVALTIVIEPASYFVALIISIMYGLYQGICNTVTRAMIPKYVKPNLVGTAYGIFYLVSGFSFLLANIIVGSLWNNLGSNLAAVYSLFLTISSLIGFAIFIKMKKIS